MSRKASMYLAGADALVDALKPLAPKTAKQIFKKASTKFAAKTRDGLRAVVGEVDGNLRKAIKSKSTRGGGAVVYADRSGGSSGKGYHAFIHRKGTKKRTTKKGANRGSDPGNPRMQRVVDGMASQFLDEVGAVVVDELKRRIAKVRAN